MRKNLYLGLIACAALTMTGCSNNEVIENAAQQSGQAIQFSTYLGKSVQGRAAALTSSSIKDFGVFASYSVGNAWGTGEKKMNFMFNQKVEKKVVESTTTWEYTPLKYWPEKNGEMISFFAYAPYYNNAETPAEAIAQKSLNSVAGAPQVTFTITNDAEKMVDFTSCVIMDKATQDDETAVTFNFKHELARVNFAAKLNYDAYGEDAANKTKVNIKSIKLVAGGDFYLKADYTFATTEGILGTWSNHTVTSTDLNVTPIMAGATPNPGDLGGYVTKGVLVPTTASVDLFTSGEYLFLIPKSDADGSVTVEIAYDIVTVDGALNDGHVFSSATKRVTIAGSQFEQGKAKKYTFTIGLHEIKVDTQVEAWSETASDAAPMVDGTNVEP